MVDCVELGDEIAGLSARLNVATHRLLTCVRRFDELGGWHEQGAQSCAHWLTWRIGLDPGAAREKVRVARALGGLPRIDDAFAAGRLSYAKVRAITRVASAQNEEDVLMVALAATGSQLERICRGYRKATEIEIEAARERRVRGRALGDGLVKLEIVVSADEADLVLKAIEHAREQLSPARSAQGDSLSGAGAAPRPSAADALVHMASVCLAGDEARAGSAAPDRCQVVIHVDRAATLEDGTNVSAETLRRVSCDGALVTATVDEGGGVLDVGRRTRAIPPAIRRALWIRDQGCRFPGCSNQRFLHGHHVQHWMHGGRTALANLVLLCSFHHREIHEGGFSLVLTSEGEVEVHTPRGERLPAQPSLTVDLGAVDWRNDRWEGDGGVGVEVDAWTAMPSWDGEPVDYEAAVGALIRPEMPLA
jgi:hypothetical protein